MSREVLTVTLHDDEHTAMEAEHYLEASAPARFKRMVDYSTHKTHYVADRPLPIEDCRSIARTATFWASTKGVKATYHRRLCD